MPVDEEYVKQLEAENEKLRNRSASFELFVDKVLRNQYTLYTAKIEGKPFYMLNMLQSAEPRINLVLYEFTLLKEIGIDCIEETSTDEEDQKVWFDILKASLPDDTKIYPIE